MVLNAFVSDFVIVRTVKFKFRMLMSLDKLVPHKGDHAIQNVAFGMEWEGVLPPQAISEIDRALVEASLELGQRKDVTTLRVNMTPDGTQATQDVSGFVYERKQGGIVARSCQLNPNLFLVTNNNYTRWDNVWSDARKILETVLPVVSNYKNVTALGLQYIDLFVWKGVPEQIPLKEIFSATGQVLPILALENKSLWHVHQGAYTDMPLPIPCRRLDNYNVDIVDIDAFRCIQILSGHRAVFSTAQPAGNLVSSASTSADSVMTALHKQNKDFLNKLLSTEVCKLINLNGAN